ncbi:hypothetical protein [Chromobacterium sp.]|uniref:hypothetical protein n=1 Tax=Chromobacterium sp. TaxID=306190 RepID=UPI0035B1B5A0
MSKVLIDVVFLGLILLSLSLHCTHYHCCFLKEKSGGRPFSIGCDLHALQRERQAMDDVFYGLTAYLLGFFSCYFLIKLVMADKRKKRARAFSIAAASDAENQSMSPSRLIEPFYYDYVSQALSVAKRDILNEAVGKVDAIWARQALEGKNSLQLKVFDGAEYYALEGHLCIPQSLHQEILGIYRQKGFAVEYRVEAGADCAVMTFKPREQTRTAERAGV